MSATHGEESANEYSHRTRFYQKLKQLNTDIHVFLSNSKSIEPIYKKKSSSGRDRCPLCDTQWAEHYSCKPPKIEVQQVERKKNDTPPSPFGTPKLKKENKMGNKEQLHPGLMGKRAGDASPFKGGGRTHVMLN